MKVKDTLKTICSYPIPDTVLRTAGLRGGLDIDNEVEASDFETVEYLKTQKYVIEYLLRSPASISEQGVSYTLGSDEIEQLRALLIETNNSIAAAEGDKPSENKPTVAFLSGAL